MKSAYVARDSILLQSPGCSRQSSVFGRQPGD